MTHDRPFDFGRLYRAAFAERDPQRKQLLLSEVQKVISNNSQEEPVSMSKLGPQSLSVSRNSAVA
jgi:hypothetical protein